MTGDDPDVGRLAEMLAQSRQAVVFTGAGISTESGIPDFRSPSGLWSQTTPIYFQEFVASEEARREAWRRKFIIDRDMQNAEPNRGHRAIAALVHREKVRCVITQNIDGLHQQSGIAPDRIIELHGNGTYARCLDCRRRYELAPIRAALEADGALPVCGACGGLVKAATISFGQAMPDGPMQAAQQAALSCDLFLAIGSSLVVYPAAGFPATAKKNGARLVIINREATDLDVMADLVLNREIGAALSAAVEVN